VQINSGGWLAPIPEIQGNQAEQDFRKKKRIIFFILVAKHAVIDKVAMKLIWMCWLIALFPLPGS
jgi:hypothetical protein